MRKLKQVSYLSAILISIGSTIGAGIFFKNKQIFENVNGSLIFLISSWLIAALGVIAIAIALIEVSSINKTGGGVLEWVKKFTPKKFSRYSASYILIIYIPLNYFALPIYSVMSLQDAVQAVHPSVTFNGWIVFALAFLVFLWIAIIGFFQQKTSEVAQWIFTFLKFIPIIIIPIFSISQIASSGIQSEVIINKARGVNGITPWLGILGSIPAILFSVDGFYTVTALKPELKNERKLGSIVALSISIIMSAYLIFALTLAASGSKDHNSLKFSKEHIWLKIIIDSIITMAIFGIVNGFALASPRMYLNSYYEQGIGIVVLAKWLFRLKKDDQAAWASSIVIAIIFYVILSHIAIYGFHHTQYTKYGSGAAGLYQIADLVTNFTSTIIFLFIGSAIFGCLINRRTKKTVVRKNSWFPLTAIISSIFISIAVLYMFISSFINIFGINNANSGNWAIKFTILVITTIIPLLPMIRPNPGTREIKIIKTVK